MKYQKYCLRIVIITFSIIITIVMINYVVDPYGIFKYSFDKQITEPNQHFIKMRYIINNPTKYESFIFGSSRVGNININKIPINENFYNMTYSEGLPNEFLNDIKIMIDKGVKIKTLLIGLDDFSFRVNPKEHLQQLMRKPYQEDIIEFYINYLLTVPNPLIIQSNLCDQPKTYFDIYGSGRPLHPQVDIDIENEPIIHINNHKFNIPTEYRGNRIKETLNELEEINQIACKNNIQLIFFINPIHQTTYLDTNKLEFNDFKQGLASISSFYDFSGINTITINNYYYYETSHYRPIVGDMIIAKIFGIDGIAPDDFGILVPKQN